MDQVQPLHVPAGLPIDQATREEHVAIGAANLLNENVRFATRGGLAKRNGFTALSTLRLDATSRTAGFKLFSYGEQMCIVDGHVLDVFDPITGVNVTRDRVSECGAVERVPLPYTSGSPLVADSQVTSNGYLVAMVMQADSHFNVSVLVNVMNAETNELVRSDLVVPLGSVALTGWAGVTVVGTKAILLYVQAGAVNTIKARTLDCSSAAGLSAGWTAAVNLCTDRFDNLAFSTTPLGDRFALIYINTAGGANQVSVRTFDATATLIAATTISTGAMGTGVSIGGNQGDTLWCSWVNAGALHKVIGLDPIGLGIVSSATTVWAGGTSTAVEGICATTFGAGQFITSQGNTGNVIFMSVAFANVAGVTTVSTTGQSLNLKPTTKPFFVDGRVYAAVAPQDVVAGGNKQQCLFVVDITAPTTTLRPIANIAPRLSLLGGLTQQVPLVSGKRFVFLNVVVRNQLSLGTTSGSFGPSFEATFLDFGDTRRWGSQEYNGNCYLGGCGVTSYFDGMLVRESGFMKRPDQPALTLAAGPGVTDTNIRYVAIYESIDASGNVEWSAVSDPSALASPANQTVNVKVSTLAVTSRYDSDAPANVVQIVIYRSTNGGAVFFRVGVVANDTTVATVTFPDNVATATVTANAQLYKVPGVPGTAQDRFSPPGLDSIVAYNGMLVGIGDDGYSPWFSAEQVIGEGTWWNPIFSFPITDEGRLLALAAMDGAEFFFKRHNLWEDTGSAPSSNGASGGFNTPSLVSANAGCREPRSVCVTAIGTFFLSDRGVELLVRGGQATQWIGEQVRQITDAFPVCTAATLDFAQERVYFELAESETNGVVGGAGRTLVYNLTQRAWESVDRRLGSDTPAQSAAMVFYGGAWRYAWLSSAGVVYVEDPTTVYDAGVWPVARYVPAWWKLGLQTNQAVFAGMILLELDGSAGLTIEFASRYGDFDPTLTKVWAETETARELDFRPTQIDWAFKTRVSDVAPAVPGGRGLAFIGMSFDIAPHVAPTSTLPNLPEAVRR